ncbi:hypothetical protein LZ663_10250, partial [Citrobacter portucalensis]|nr:hypothetical protein [Citrobacter portucalensis]
GDAAFCLWCHCLEQNPIGIGSKNDAANWVTVTEVKANNVKINNESIMLAPLSSTDVALKIANANQYKMTIIDDHGNYISHNVSLK